MKIMEAAAAADKGRIIPCIDEFLGEWCGYRLVIFEPGEDLLCIVIAVSELFGIVSDRFCHVLRKIVLAEPLKLPDVCLDGGIVLSGFCIKDLYLI